MFQSSSQRWVGWLFSFYKIMGNKNDRIFSYCRKENFGEDWEKVGEWLKLRRVDKSDFMILFWFSQLKNEIQIHKKILENHKNAENGKKGRNDKNQEKAGNDKEAKNCRCIKESHASICDTLIFIKCAHSANLYCYQHM